MKNDNIVNDSMAATVTLGFIAMFIWLAVEAMQHSKFADAVDNHVNQRITLYADAMREAGLGK